MDFKNDENDIVWIAPSVKLQTTFVHAFDYRNVPYSLDQPMHRYQGDEENPIV